MTTSPPTLHRCAAFIGDSDERCTWIGPLYRCGQTSEGTLIQALCNKHAKWLGYTANDLADSKADKEISA